MSRELDSLPYIDLDLQQTPALGPQLSSLINKELSKLPTKTIHPDVVDIPPPKVTFQEKITPLDRTRYTLPSLPSTSSTSVIKLDSLSNASAQLAHQSLRLSNLELLQKFGADKWKLVNWELEKEVERMEDGRAAWEARRDEINRSRKGEQEDAGEVLTALEKRWTEGLSRVVMLDVENLRMEMEVEELERRVGEVGGRLKQMGVEL